MKAKVVLSIDTNTWVSRHERPAVVPSFFVDFMTAMRCYRDQASYGGRNSIEVGKNATYLYL